MSQTRFYFISAAGELRPLSGIQEALSQRGLDGYIWLDYFKPSREDLSVLIDSLGIHPLSIEDCLDEAEIAKIEDFPSHHFILFNAYHYHDKQLLIDEVDFFLGQDFVISVSGALSDDLHTAYSFEKMVSNNLKTIKQGPDFLLHLLLDNIVDNKSLAIEALEEDIDGAEEKILGNVHDFKMDELSLLRRNVLTLRKSLFHEREILIKLCRRDCPYVSDKAIYHYRDIYDHLTKFFEETDLYREMIFSLMEMYLSIVNNHMSMVANRTNITLRRLTFITTIFMPLTLLASIGGMSEWSMMTGPENWKVSYPLFLLGLVVLGMISYVLLLRLDTKASSIDPLEME